MFYNNFLKKNEKYEEDLVESSNKYDIRYGLKNALLQHPVKDKAKKSKTNLPVSHKLFDARIDENYLSIKDNEKSKQAKIDNAGSKQTNTTPTNVQNPQVKQTEKITESSGIFGFIGSKIKDTGYFNFGGEGK